MTSTGPTDVRPLLLGKEWFPDVPGGLNRYLRGLVLGFEAAGVDYRAVVTGTASDAPPRVDAVRGPKYPQRVLAAWNAARRAAPGRTVVNAHFAAYAAPLVLAPPLRGLPLVVHFHGPWANESAVAGETDRRLTIIRSLERTLYRRADAFVVLSRAFADVLVERYGVERSRVHVIPPGVELDRFRPDGRNDARARLGLDPDTRVAFTVRRLTPRMGLDVLIDAWAQVDGADTFLAVAGDGAERTSLEQAAQALGLGGRIRFLGRVSDEDLLLWHRAADVCLVPTVSLEGFGLVVLEALASGTPVIGTDVGGLPETLRGLQPDLVVPAGDAAALADRIRAGLDGSAPLPHRAACRAFAERYSWDAAVARVLDVFRSVGG